MCLQVFFGFFFQGLPCVSVSLKKINLKEKQASKGKSIATSFTFNSSAFCEREQKYFEKVFQIKSEPWKIQ